MDLVHIYDSDDEENPPSPYSPLRVSFPPKIMSVGASSSSSNSITGTYVTEGIWFEVFLHLPFDSIFKFKCVSKVWFSILSDPGFINSWYKINKLSLPWGLFIYANSNEPFRGNRVKRLFTYAYPDSHSGFVSHRRQNGFSLNFINPVVPDNACYIANIKILGSSNGLVLCGTILSNKRRYYVCNPLTKNWVLLPPPLLSPTNMGMVATGFICSGECDFVSFKVICIPKFETASENFKVEVFSSDLGEWNIYNVLRPQCFTWSFSFNDHFVTCNDFFYWMRKRCKNILASSVNKYTNHGTCGNECRLINLPEQAINNGVQEYMHDYLGESEGSTCYVKIKYIEKSLSVWVLEDNWYLVQKDINFRDTLTEMVSLLIGRTTRVDSFELFGEIQVVGLNPVDKNVVIFAYQNYIWAYNTRTKGSEQLLHPSFMSSNDYVPHYGAYTFAFQPRPMVLPPVSR